MGDHEIEWLDDPGERVPVTPPRRGTPKLTILVVAAFVAVAIGLVITKSVTHTHRHIAVAKSPSAVAVKTPSRPPSPAITSYLTDTPPTPTESPATPDPVVHLKSCASLAGTSGATWVSAVGAYPDGCTLDGKTSADFSVLPCNSKISLYTSTATGTWYWGETGGVLHYEAAQASPDTFIEAYRHCVGFNTTRCLTANQALALISRGHPGTLLPAPSTGYRCVDGWAFINFYSIPESSGATEVLHVEHGEWLQGNRRLGCGDGVHPPAMPAAIRMGGCGD